MLVYTANEACQRPSIIAALNARSVFCPQQPSLIIIIFLLNYQIPTFRNCNTCMNQWQRNDFIHTSNFLYFFLLVETTISDHIKYESRVYLTFHIERGKWFKAYHQLTGSLPSIKIPYMCINKSISYAGHRRGFYAHFPSPLLFQLLETRMADQIKLKSRVYLPLHTVREKKKI